MYSSNTYASKGWFKIGQTERDADTRIKEQDSTSNPEPLKKFMEWEVPAYINDNEIHSLLLSKGYSKTRTDANREWFEIMHDDPISIVHESILELDEQFKSKPQNVIVSDQLWLQQYELNKQLNDEKNKKFYADEIDKSISLQTTLLAIKNPTSENISDLNNNQNWLNTWINEYLPWIDKYAESDFDWKKRKALISDFKVSVEIKNKAHQQDIERMKGTLFLLVLFITPLVLMLLQK